MSATRFNYVTLDRAYEAKKSGNQFNTIKEIPMCKLKMYSLNPPYGGVPGYIFSNNNAAPSVTLLYRGDRYQFAGAVTNLDGETVENAYYTTEVNGMCVVVTVGEGGKVALLGG